MRRLISILLLLLMAYFVVLSQNNTTGYASYYSNIFHGRKTASGILYNKDSLTCAHKKYPFGTILKIINKKNNKWVYVKVTDRGPFIKGRHIDLSYAAAKEIDMLHKGVIYVKIIKY